MIRASASAVKTLSTSLWTSSAWLIRFIDEIKEPSAQASAVRQVKLSIFCPDLRFQMHIDYMKDKRSDIDLDMQNCAEEVKNGMSQCLTLTAGRLLGQLG